MDANEREFLRQKMQIQDRFYQQLSSTAYLPIEASPLHSREFASIRG